MEFNIDKRLPKEEMEGRKERGRKYDFLVFLCSGFLSELMESL